MNFKRKQFLSLMDRIAAGDISRLIVAHKDRLVRFGFDLLDHIAKRSACVIEVVNQESLSPQEEMTEDLRFICPHLLTLLTRHAKIPTTERLTWHFHFNNGLI